VRHPSTEDRLEYVEQSLAVLIRLTHAVCKRVGIEHDDDVSAAMLDWEHANESMREKRRGVSDTVRPEDEHTNPGIPRPNG